MIEYQKENNLKQSIFKLNKEIRHMYLGALLSVIAALIFWSFNQEFLSMLSAGGGFLCFSIANNRSKQKEIFEYGLTGEESLKRTLRNILSDDYAAFYNVPFNGIGDVDCIVVGRSSVYIFEAKHHAGEISFTGDGWIQIKIGRRGTAYHGNLSNPTKQLDKAIRKVRDFLKGNGVDMWVKGIVVFTNPNTSLFLQKELKVLTAVKIDDIDSVFQDNARCNDIRLKKKIEKIKSLFVNI